MVGTEVVLLVGATVGFLLTERLIVGAPVGFCLVGAIVGILDCAEDALISFSSAKRPT